MTLIKNNNPVERAWSKALPKLENGRKVKPVIVGTVQKKVETLP
jgi:hypothetical protein